MEHQTDLSLGFNSSRIHLERFVRRAAGSVRSGARVLDAGAGDCQHRRWFAHVDYESADFCQVAKAYGDVSFVCDLRSIPVGDDRYDLVLLTQVLEHVPEPLEVLKELHRVLKPGGSLWLSAPLFYEEHEAPYDFFRYTQFGLQYLLERAGLRVVELGWLEGYYGTLAYQFRVASQRIPAWPAAYGGGWIGILASVSARLLRPTLSLISLGFARLDVHHKYTSGGQCKNYYAIASKRLDDPAERSSVTSSIGALPLVPA